MGWFVLVVRKLGYVILYLRLYLWGGPPCSSFFACLMRSFIFKKPPGCQFAKTLTKMSEASPRRSRSPIDRDGDPGRADDSDRAPVYGRIYHLRLINEDNDEPHFFQNLVNRNYEFLVDGGWTIVTMWADANLCHILYHRPPRIVAPPPTRQQSPDTTVPNMSPPWSLGSSYGSMPSLVEFDEYPPTARNNDSASR